MCKQCVREQFPDRQRTCHESGIFFSNLKTGACTSCGKFDFLKHETNVERTEEENEDGVYEESIAFNHSCIFCKHLVAEHSYSFVVDGNKQLYSMLCLLCGKGQDESSLVKPNGGKTVEQKAKGIEKSASDFMKGFATSIKLVDDHNKKAEEEDAADW